MPDTNPERSTRQSLGGKAQRKVRAPQDRMPDNIWEVRTYGKCHRKYTAPSLPVIIFESNYLLIIIIFLVVVG